MNELEITGEHHETTRLFAFLPILIGVYVSCSLFDNKQIPECLKSSSEDSPSILTCYNPLYFERPAWHPGGEWIAVEP
jgi:hypothetical protein